MCSFIASVSSFIFWFIFLHTSYMKRELTFQFSDQGSNKLPDERQTYINFVDFLDECDG